jgi:hypothetical protein
MGFVLMLHSLVRWVIVLVAIVAAVKFAPGWLRGGAFGKMDKGLASGYAGLLDLQGALGLIYLLWDGYAGGGWPLGRLEHTGLMIVAIVLAHLSARLPAANDKLRFRNLFLGVVGSLVLIVLGVALIGGWAR